ncbi:MAG: arylesterase [Gemmatimonadales bacterium]
MNGTRVGKSCALIAALVAVASCSRSNGSSRSANGSTGRSNASAAAPVSSDSLPARGGQQSTKSSGAAAGNGRRVVLFAGTSLTAGLGLDPDSAYPMLIQRKIDSAGLPFDVVNAGVSGETSAGLLDRLGWLLRAHFDVLVLETGANDGLRGVPPATLKTNIETALDRIQSSRPGAQIVLVQMEALPNLGPKYAADFHAAYPAVAKEKKVPLLPFLLAGVAGKRELNQGDGVHPNDRGEHIVADNVWRGLRPILEQVAHSRTTP